MALLGFIYSIGFLFFSIFYLPFFLIKGKHKGGFLERFGVVPPEIRKKLAEKNVFWIHAVSVGEMTQGLRLVEALRKKIENVQFVLTATTAAGKEIAEKFKKTEDVALYFPVDFRASVDAFIRAVDPKAMIILETEIWPNLLAELSKRQVPVFILNGRISDRAFPKYRAIKLLLKPILNRFTWIGVQDTEMRNRFLALGAAPEKVAVTGNIKYDWTPPVSKDGETEKIERRFKTPGSVLCVAGSTHEGEEAILFDRYKVLRAKHPFFKMIIAPRHLDRMASIEAEAFRRDLALQKASTLLKSEDSMPANEAVLVIDKMGVLANLYRIADFVFVGGSLVPRGGHNLIEPAYFEKPIVFGRFMDNFKEMAAEFKKAGAAAEVRDEEALKSTFSRLIEEPPYRQQLGTAAKRLIELHQGATERNIQAVIQNLRK